MRLKLHGLQVNDELCEIDGVHVEAMPVQVWCVYRRALLTLFRNAPRCLPPPACLRDMNHRPCYTGAPAASDPLARLSPMFFLIPICYVDSGG